MVRWFPVMLAFGLSNVAYSLEERVEPLPVSTNLSLATGEQQVLFFELAEGAYLRGHLHASTSFKASIQNADGELTFRHLVPSGGTEARVFFVAPATDRYRLSIDAIGQALDLTVSLENVALLERGIKEEDAMPSPMVLAAELALENGDSYAQVWEQLTAQGTPLVEPVSHEAAADLIRDERLVTFLWQGAEERVQVLGALGHDHDELYRLGESNIWYRSYRLPADTRMSYQLAPDVPRVDGSKREQRVAILATAQQDSTNPQAWSPDGLTDPYNTKSIVQLDQAPAAFLPEPADAAPGVQSYRLYDDSLGNTRSIDIWVPDELRSGVDGPASLAIFFDGRAYQQRIPTPGIMQKLMRLGRIPPTVAVFVDNPDNAARARELPCHSDFADFMVDNLLPFVEEKTSLQFAGKQTLLAGASYGGLAAACTAFRYPEHFGMVLSQSGSFWWSPAEEDRTEWLTARLAESPGLPIRFYLSAGRFEESFGESGILSANRRLEQILGLKGYQVELEEFSAGHDYYHWRATLGRGLEKLLAD